MTIKFAVNTKNFKSIRESGAGVISRVYGPRWNEKNCAVGRHVIISRQRHKDNLLAKIIGFDREGVRAVNDVALIKVEVTNHG